jgi:hypothetical protein
MKEWHIPFTAELNTDDGDVTVPSTVDFPRRFVGAFRGFISRVYTAPRRWS